MDYGLSYPFKDFSDQFGQIGSNIGEWNKNRRIGNAMEGDGDLRAKAQRLLEMGYTAEARTVAAMAEGQRRTDIDAYEAKGRYAGGPQSKPMPGTVMKQYNDATTNATNLGNTIKFLEEAQGLIGDDGQGIYEGITGPIQTQAGTKLNVGGALEQGEDWVNKTFGTNLDVVNKEKAVNTSRFQQIMESESLKLLSNELKGPTAVQEVMTYKKIVADDTKTNKERAIALKGMIAAIKRNLAAQGKSIENIEKVYGAPGGTASGADTSAGGQQPPEDAIAALRADPELREQFEEFYGVSADEYLQ
jgi:hypothetical protein